MNFAQAVFLTAFGVVTVAIVAAVWVIVRSARRMDGGAYPSLSKLWRLGRRPAERGGMNRWAFYAHRVSGLAILAFLCLHVLDVSVYAFSPTVFDQVHRLYATVPMRLFECGLLLALLFHALNGLRVVAIDLWDLGGAAASRLLNGVVGATVVLTIAGSVVILRPVIG